MSIRSWLYADEANICPKKGLDDCNYGDGSLQCQLRRLSEEKFTAIFQPGVSKATFRDFTVRITRSEGVQKVTLNFNSLRNDAAEACVQVAGSPRVSSCGVVPELAGAGLKADFEPQTGRLVLSLPIDLKVILNGYLNKEGTFLVSAEQNEVGGLRAFAGKTLWMELFPTRLDGQRPYLSGKALVKDGTLDVAQGTASYLLDARFYKRLGTFCTQVRKNAPGTITASP